MRKMDRKNSAEPWLSAPTRDLYDNVQGFMSFLDKNGNNVAISAVERSEISIKLSQLKAWTGLVSHLFNNCEEKEEHLPLRMKLVKQKESFNFIDDVDLRFEQPDVTTSSINGHLVQVLTTKPDGVNHGRTGYILEKCIRKVERENENREIFTAKKCEVDVNFKIGSVNVKEIQGEQVVVKRVGKIGSQVKNNEFFNESLRREFKAQTLLTALQHPNINPILSYYEDNENMYSVSKSAGESDLMDLLSGYVTNFNKGLPEYIVKRLLLDAAMGLSVAHNVGVAHRDVSLENLVLKGKLNASNGLERTTESNNGDNEEMKFSEDVENGYGGDKALIGNDIERCVQVIDWGHCYGLKLNNDREGSFSKAIYEGPIGKVRYMSPELLLLQRDLERMNCQTKQGFRRGTIKYDALKADVFAFGVCLFSMLVGQMPFETVIDRRGSILREGAKVLLKRLRVTQISGFAVDLLSKTLAWRPEDRLNMNEVVNHPFFNC